MRRMTARIACVGIAAILLFGGQAALPGHHALGAGRWADAGAAAAVKAAQALLRTKDTATPKAPSLPIGCRTAAQDAADQKVIQAYAGKLKGREWGLIGRLNKALTGTPPAGTTIAGIARLRSQLLDRVSARVARAIAAYMAAPERALAVAGAAGDIAASMQGLGGDPRKIVNALAVGVRRPINTLIDRIRKEHYYTLADTIRRIASAAQAARPSDPPVDMTSLDAALAKAFSFDAELRLTLDYPENHWVLDAKVPLRWKPAAAGGDDGALAPLAPERTKIGPLAGTDNDGWYSKYTDDAGAGQLSASHFVVNARLAAGDGSAIDPCSGEATICARSVLGGQRRPTEFPYPGIPPVTASLARTNFAACFAAKGSADPRGDRRTRSRSSLRDRDARWVDSSTQTTVSAPEGSLHCELAFKVAHTPRK